MFYFQLVTEVAYLTESQPRRPHDLGGVPRTRSIDRDQHELLPWEILTVALQGALTARYILTLDELRRATEDLIEYDSLSYFEKRAVALERILEEKGLLAGSEIDFVLERTGDDGVNTLPLRPREPRFSVGSDVEVFYQSASTGHIRTPAYVQGMFGQITGVHGPARNPELLAYGQDGFPEVWVYSVAFRVSHLFGDSDETAQEFVEIDLFEHWLNIRNFA